jgi:thiamine-phosphate pyrophosphorylase
MKPEIDYSLYLVTDRTLTSTPTLEEAVEQAIAGGCTLVQLREKTASSLEFYRSALSIKRVTDAHGVPLIINDRVDVALAVDAAGVHVGQSDLPADVVRRMIGPDRILGVSVRSVAEAVQAEADGADYLGVGAMFATTSKQDAEPVSLAELRRIRATTALPLVAIGGVNRETIPALTGTGIDGVAVISALVAAPDIAAAARELRGLVRLL